MEVSAPASVVVLAYDGVAADETGAVVEILSSSGLDVIITSVGPAAVTSFHGRVIASRTVGDLQGCRALIVPGGMGVRQAAENQQLLAAVRQLADSATWLGATSTGSILLAASGAVVGGRATTHWLAGDLLASQGLTLVRQPFVEHGRLLTASGLFSSGTLAFRLIGALVGVEAERQAVDRYRGYRHGDARYQRRPSFWRRIGRRRVVSSAHPLDPSGRAEIVLLDLDDQGD